MKKEVEEKYVPKTLHKKDYMIQSKNLVHSRKMYKKGIYINRKPIKSFTSKKSNHIINAMKMYSIQSITPSKELSRKTGCSVQGLERIVKKGMGAYYSSGSRPNQTPLSWGYARLGSSITGNKASIIDNHILQEECNKGSKALLLSNRAKAKAKAKSTILSKKKSNQINNSLR
jgi:hypothetical protein